jgi:pimeloyl-ACP methyl ester carboxylesterase
MTTFVLVHGAWHGGWCYKHVAQLLRAQGHEVYTPTLTGLGERAHLASQSINLDTYIRDVMNVFEYEDLTDVVLCGHSLGGIVITGVGAEIPQRIRSLVFLDALVPESGQGFFDIASKAGVAFMLSQAAANNGMVPPFPASSYKGSPAHEAWIDAKCVPQALAGFVQGVKKGVETMNSLCKTYIFASVNDRDTFRETRDRLSKDPSWKTYDVPSGHEVMLEAPEELARLLLLE